MGLFWCEYIEILQASVLSKTIVLFPRYEQKLILPNYGYSYSDEEGALTYNNYDKNCYHKISRKTILNFLKGLDTSYIELYLKNIDTIENKIIEKALVRKLDD